jgi:hypothetical protein
MGTVPIKETKENSLTDIRLFLSTAENPVSMAEFRAFWESCTPLEKEEFKNADLP